MCTAYRSTIMRALEQILTRIPHDHPAASLTALWMVENDDILGAVPQPWDRSHVDPAIWRALSQLVARKLDATLEQSSISSLVRLVSERDLQLDPIEIGFLDFLVACTHCADFATLVEILSDGTGLTRAQVYALCTGATEALILDMLEGRLDKTGLIENGRASAALVRG